ncbi:MAG: hypothetical protein EHM66_00485 [Deltaproteobacteria bacterium]|nr:MAG: hypothetical protein EHM66_00485 [Deltaproteobacteria bacterium]
MNYTHGGLPESEAWTWAVENQRKLGQIVADLENKEKAGKARNAYYELKRHFMAGVWTKFISDLTDFRKQNGFRGINELLADASPITIQKGEGMTMNEAALKRIAGGFAEISEGILMLAGSAAPVETPKATGKAAKVAEKPAEPAIDFAKLRQECKEIILDQVKVKGKDKIVALLAEFKATKLPEVKDDQLVALKAALDKEKAVEPEAVA